LKDISVASTGYGVQDTVYAAPAGAVRIAAGTDIQSVIDKYPAGTAYILGAGTHYVQSIRPESGDKFYGENGGTILDGNGAAKAFAGQGVTNVTIAGLKFTDYAPPTQGVGVLGTDGGSSNWQVLGNEFYGINAGTVIMLGNSMVVRDNYIHDNNWTGIGAWNVTGAIIENNELARNNLSGQSPFTATGDGSAIKITQATGTQILNNYIHDNVASAGVWTDINCDLTMVDGNLIERNQAGGIFIELDYGATIRNNIIKDNNTSLYDGFQGGGIYVFNAQDVDIYANTFSGNGGAVWVYEENRGSGNQGPWITQDVNVYGNTIVASSGRNGIGGSATNDPSIRFYDNDYALTGSATLVYGNNISASQWQSLGYDTAASGSTFGTTAPPPPTSSLPTPVALTIGSGPDTLVLKISQDAWQGSAQYTVAVDGVQQGGTLTASASHAAGQSDTLTIKGDWATGGHSVSVNFLNDDYGGSASADRNLYLDSMSYNGSVVNGASAYINTNGPRNFDFTDGSAVQGRLIVGSKRADVLTGTAGNDTITGGAGNDILTGGAGEDSFTFGAKSGFDRIKDFTPGVDEILFTGIAASAVRSEVKTIGGVTGLDITYSSSGSDHVFLENVTALKAGDIIFA